MHFQENNTLNISQEKEGFNTINSIYVVLPEQTPSAPLTVRKNPEVRLSTIYYRNGRKLSF